MGTTINQLSTASSAQGSDQFLFYSSANGDTRKISLTALMTYISANLGDAAGNSLTLASTVKTTAGLVSNLPSATLSGAGARDAVTDATQTLAVGHGATVVGGGANIVPVFSNGTNWLIG